MPFTKEQIEQWEQDRKKREEAELEFVRRLMDAVSWWQHCEHRQCKRVQSCAEPRTCQTKYADDILWWKRTYLVPYLRKRYPSVQWGAPASITRPQLEAALAAEADRKAPHKARKEGKPIPRKRRCKRVPRQPLYTPPDFAGGLT